MPGPSDAAYPQLSAEDAFLELLVETLDNMDRPARAHFLQRFFRTIAQVELTEPQSLELWEQILKRRRELLETFGRPISLKTAMVDVLASSNFLRMPVLMEYEELKKLQINAATDPLTGLYNRRLFEEYFDKELNRARRYGQSLALVVMDLHEFKEVNDRHGHPRGDQVLQAAASTLRKSLRTSDYAFRIGGDEFALLLPQTDPEQAATLSRRVHNNFGVDVQPMRLDVAVGFDYGLAVFPQDGDEKEVLLRVADQRLYQFKQQGAQPSGEARPSPTVLPREQPEPELPPAESGRPSEAPSVAPAKPEADRRKWERVSMVGTKAHARFGEATGQSARVLDLSYGGVALETEAGGEFAESFQAVLHVPILPPVRVHLRRVYWRPGPGGTARVGCSFVS